MAAGTRVAGGAKFTGTRFDGDHAGRGRQRAGGDTKNMSAGFQSVKGFGANLWIDPQLAQGRWCLAERVDQVLS